MATPRLPTSYRIRIPTERDIYLLDLRDELKYHEHDRRLEFLTIWAACLAITVLLVPGGSKGPVIIVLLLCLAACFWLDIENKRELLALRSNILENVRSNYTSRAIHIAQRRFNADIDAILEPLMHFEISIRPAKLIEIDNFLSTDRVLRDSVWGAILRYGNKPRGKELHPEVQIAMNMCWAHARTADELIERLRDRLEAEPQRLIAVHE